MKATGVVGKTDKTQWKQAGKLQNNLEGGMYTGKNTCKTEQTKEDWKC